MRTKVRLTARAVGRLALRGATLRLALAAVVCLAIVLFASVSTTTSTAARDRFAASHPAAPKGRLPAGAPSIRLAARNGIRQLAGLGGPSPAAEESTTGLWGGHTKPNWWQSALALLALVRYLERTHNTQPVYQQHILKLYRINVRRPGTHAPLNFANEFNDDTGWWGVAWVEAARYELAVRHDTAAAQKFLKVGEWDANFIGRQKRRCGGIEWGPWINQPPDTVTTAEYMAMTAGLARLREAPGLLHDRARATKWIGRAEWALNWLKHSGLVNMKTGKIYDKLTGRCKRFGGPLTYSEGELADALIQLGLALHQPSYYRQAGVFLHYTVYGHSGLVQDGIIREKCEALRKFDYCNHLYSYLNIPSYKGLLVNAISDWSLVTGLTRYQPFLNAQARAVITNALVGSGNGRCRTAATCLFAFYWRPKHLSKSRVTLGSQESALEALTAALPAVRVGGSPVVP